MSTRPSWLLWTTSNAADGTSILAVMSHDPTNEDFSFDVNGCLTERIAMDGLEVIIRYDDIPESDITVVQGLRCTTALRTVIDLAAGLEWTELEDVVRDCLNRGLFARAEAMHRVSQPDMLARPVRCWCDKSCAVSATEFWHPAARRPKRTCSGRTPCATRRRRKKPAYGAGAVAPSRFKAGVGRGPGPLQRGSVIRREYRQARRRSAEPV